MQVTVRDKKVFPNIDFSNMFEEYDTVYVVNTISLKFPSPYLLICYFFEAGA